MYYCFKYDERHNQNLSYFFHEDDLDHFPNDCTYLSHIPKITNIGECLIAKYHLIVGMSRLNSNCNWVSLSRVHNTQ